jgi:rhodanese-related sulfurtransferase
MKGSSKTETIKYTVEEEIGVNVDSLECHSYCCLSKLFKPKPNQLSDSLRVASNHQNLYFSFFFSFSPLVCSLYWLFSLPLFSLPTTTCASSQSWQQLAISSLEQHFQALAMPVSAYYARPCVSVLPSYPTTPRWTSQSFHSTSFRQSKETSWANKGKITYKELKPITDAPTGEVTIIEVREPDEVQAGMIPAAVNVPLTQFEKAFAPNGGADFQEKFSFPRPSFNDQLVFYCRSGKRSEQALQMAKKNGWQK